MRFKSRIRFILILFAVISSLFDLYGQKGKSTADPVIKFFTLKDSSYNYWTRISEPIQVPNFTQTQVNSQGNLYAIVQVGGLPQIAKLVNNEWQLIGAAEKTLNGIVNDTSGNCFVNIGGNTWYRIQGDTLELKYPTGKWNENEITLKWDNLSGYQFEKKKEGAYAGAYFNKPGIIYYPPNVKRYYRENTLNKLFDAFGNLYTIAKQDNDTTYRLFQYKQEQWKVLSEIKKQSGIINAFPYYEESTKLLISEGKVYLIKWNHDNYSNKNYITVYLYTGGSWDINSFNVAYIPNKITPGKVTNEFPVSYVKHYLFTENGRYGIIDNKGNVFANPVFDHINIIKTPLSISKQNELGEAFNEGYTFWCYELVRGNDTIYTPISTVQPEPGTLFSFDTKPASICSYCNGKGVTEEKTIMVQTKKWVEPVTISKSTSTDYYTHYDVIQQKKITEAVTRTYTSTMPGHWEYSNIPKVIPKEKCHYCKGNPVKKNYTLYVYDDEQKFYIKK